MRSAATQAMSVSVVEALQRRRCPPAAAPRKAVGTGPTTFFSCIIVIGLGLGSRSKVACYFCASPEENSCPRRAKFGAGRLPVQSKRNAIALEWSSPSAFPPNPGKNDAALRAGPEEKLRTRIALGPICTTNMKVLA